MSEEQYHEEESQAETTDQISVEDSFEISTPTEIAIYVGDHKVVAVFPPEDDPTFLKEQDKLLEGRFDTRRGKFKNKTNEAAINFFNRTCRDIRGITQRGVPVNNQMDGWKKIIPPRIKVSFATYFQESQIESLEEMDQD